jgi:hypothetical protein
MRLFQIGLKIAHVSLLKIATLKQEMKMLISKMMVSISPLPLLMACMVLGGWTHTSVSASEAGVKQAVFLFCPHTSDYNACSLYVIVDSKDSSKVLSIGIEELKKQNSKDTSYADVLLAQNNPKIEHKFMAELCAKNFGSGQLKVEKQDALHLWVTPQSDRSLALTISMRVGACERFLIGGLQKSVRNVALVYDPIHSVWQAQVKTLTDSNGQKVPLAIGKNITGIIFTMTSSGVDRILSVMENGDWTSLMDHSVIAKEE